MCGGHANASTNGSCPGSLCGGAGCLDASGQRLCGGEGCDGAMSASAGALKLAKEVAGNITKAGEELQRVTKKVHALPVPWVLCGKISN